MCFNLFVLLFLNLHCGNLNSKKKDISVLKVLSAFGNNNLNTWSFSIVFKAF